MTARDGMSDLISCVRGMINAGTADYTINSVSYWSDDLVQDALDRHRLQLTFLELKADPTYLDSDTVYQRYLIGFDQIESGTAVFSVQDSTGANQGTAGYSVDYQLGIVTFTADQGGSARYVNARSYDINAAAADIWGQKMAHVAASVSWSTDNMRMEKGSLIKNCQFMVDYYSRLVRVTSMDVLRGDEP